jgi:hypothetical protein
MPELDMAIENTDNAFGALNLDSETLVSKFSNGINSVVGFAGSLMALNSSMQGVVSSFTEGGTVMEKVMAIMTFATTLIPVVTSLT